MKTMPRVAVGTIQPEADHYPILWAFLNVLSQAGLHVQPFLAQARFPKFDGATSATGQGYRHLDTWVMSPDQCRDTYARAASESFGVVEGRFDVARLQVAGGRLDELCDGLDLPRLAIVDATRLRSCSWPDLPKGTCGVLLDRVASPREAYELETTLIARWGTPVIGFLKELPALRGIVRGLQRGANPSPQLCSLLGDHLAPSFQMKTLLQIAQRPAAFPVPIDSLCHGERVRMKVALAYDEAFNRHFQDTFDRLESLGADIQVFSPIRSGSLPAGADLVYVGCGHPEHYAELLSRNQCLHQAVRNHVRRGGRVYAEGSGFAWLCESLMVEHGRRLPMVAVLPAVAMENAIPSSPTPVELTASRATWLAPQGSKLRGYLNTTWVMMPTGRIESLAMEPERHRDLLTWQGVVASRVHLNLAAHEDLLPALVSARHRSVSGDQFARPVTPE